MHQAQGVAVEEKLKIGHPMTAWRISESFFFQLSSRPSQGLGSIALLQGIESVWVKHNLSLKPICLIGHNNIVAREYLRIIFWSALYFYIRKVYYKSLLKKLSKFSIPS